MTKQNDARWKAVAISVIWLSVGIASLHLGFFTLGLGIFAFLATLSVCEA